MSVPVEEMERQRRVPVARPAVQQLTQQPGAAFASQARGEFVPVRPSVAAGSTPPLANTSVPVGQPGNPVQLGEAGQRARASGSAAAQLRAAPAPVATPAPAAAAPARTPAAAAVPGRFGLGKVGPAARAIPAVAEGFNVVDAYQTGGVDAAARQGVNSAGRLAGAEIGAQVGGSLPLPGWGKPAAALLGGVAGFVAGDKLTQSQVGRDAQLRDMQVQRLTDDLAPTMNANNTVTTSDGRMFGSGRLESDPMLQVQGYIDAQAGRRVASNYPLVNPTVAEMESLGTFTPQPQGRAAGGAAPTAAQQLGSADFSGVQGGSRGRLLGTFSGERTGTRNVYEGEQLAPAANSQGSFNVVPASTFTGGAATQLGAAPARGTGRSSGGAQGAVIGMPGASTIERIDKAIADIGPLDRRGRRAAVADLLGLRDRVEQGGADREQRGNTAAAEIDQRTAASQLAADVDREQIASTSQNARRQTQQLVTGADGTTYAVNGTTVSPLTTTTGEQFRTATRADTGLQTLAGQLLSSSLESGLVTDPNAAAAQAANAARALQANMNAPAGMTYIGTQNGKPVYQNAQGQRFVDE